MTLTEEQLAEVISLATASGRCDGYGRVRKDDAAALADATSPDPCLWYAYQVDGEGEYLACAVTGNGPTSEANARFYSAARHVVLSLVEEIRRLAEELEDLREDAKHCHEFLDSLGVIRGQVEEGGLVRYNVFGRLDSHATTITVGALLPGEA